MNTLIYIGNRGYYLATEAAEAHRVHFKGCCGRNVRKIPEKKGVPAEQYIFAKEKKGIWEESTIEYNRAKLLLSKEWVDVLVGGGKEVDSAPENMGEEKYEMCPVKKDQFKLSAAQYSGCTADLQRQLEEQVQKVRDVERAARFSAELLEVKTAAELERLKAVLELERAQKDMEILRLSKDLEIAELKLKLSEK